MDTGKVKWLSPQKGYGFIASPDNDNDVVVHISALERARLTDLRKGQKVSFEVVADQRSGKRFAEKLKLI